MSNQQTSCVHRGNTFFGDVEVVTGGPDHVVRVRYNGDVREAPLDGFTVEVVAHILLRELVLNEFEVCTSVMTESPARTVSRRTSHSCGWAA